LPDVTHDGHRWSNADQDRVDLVEYDAQWPTLFAVEASRIHSALGGLTEFTLEHFGSTAIPGLAAKPIIDIMMIVADESQWPRLVEPLKSLGYVFWADNPRHDRMFFVKGMPPFGERRTHHLHVRTPSHARASILFRDYLRRNPEERLQYASLKRELAARFPVDRDAYTEGKKQFVDKIVGKAELSRGAV
jgi:GrpB-like predicted nucleotidyltransferase (UPF0157 family)